MIRFNKRLFPCEGRLEIKSESILYTRDYRTVNMKLISINNHTSKKKVPIYTVIKSDLYTDYGVCIDNLGR